MYVWFGTNEYNFERLANPPEYEPTRCTGCQKLIRLAEEGYMLKGSEYLCEACASMKSGLRFP
jgi:hypothetical protein